MASPSTRSCKRTNKVKLAPTLPPILQPQPRGDLPREYEELRDAATRFFKACGSYVLCGACFAGELSEWRRGCCGSCQNLASTGCMDKPVGCAVFSCNDLRSIIPRFMQDRIKRLERRWNDIRRLSEYKRAGSIGPRVQASYNICYSSAVRDDAATGWEMEQLLAMRAMTASYNRMTRWIEMTGYHPNWPLMENIFQFKHDKTSHLARRAERIRREGISQQGGSPSQP